jgi:hypothetical protein
VSRSIPFGRRGHGELLFDVLNVLNDTAEEGVAIDNLVSSNFGRASMGGVTQFAFLLRSCDCKSLIRNGEMSEWLSSSAAMPLRRDISR